MNNHEDFSRDEGLRSSSDRTFGFVFTAFFLATGLFPMFKHHPPRQWSLIASGACLLVALVYPALLHPANFLWTRLAVLLNKIVSPIVTGLVFYLVFTPMGVLMRMCGKDPLRLRFESNKNSYWMERNPAGPLPESMSNQF